MTSARRQPLALWLAAVTSAAMLSCGLSQEGVQPHADTISFPASAVMDISGDWLIVANSNADLRYNDGTLVAVNVAKAAADRRIRGVTLGDGTTVPAEICPAVNYVNPRGDGNQDFCCIDPLDPYILICDERRYVDPSASVRIGSFAAGMLRQDPSCAKPPDRPKPDGGAGNPDGGATDPDGGAADTDAGPPPDPNPCAPACDPMTLDAQHQRLLIAVRGNTSLTYVDVKPGKENTPPVFDCTGVNDPINEGQGKFPACDEDHRVIETEGALASASGDDNPPIVRFPDEPYALALDEDSGLLYVGHLSGSPNRPGSGGVSLFDVAPVTPMLPDQPPPMPPPPPVMRPPRFIASFPGIFAPNANGLYGVTSLNWVQGAARARDRGSAMFATSRYIPLVTSLAATDPLTCRYRKVLDTEPVREIAVFGTGEGYSTTLSGTETRGIQIVKFGVDEERAFVLQRVPPALVSFSGGTPAEYIEVCQSPTFLHKHDAGAGDRLFINCFDTGEIYVVNPAIPKLERVFGVGRGPAGLVFPDNDKTIAYVVGFGDNNISVIDVAPGSPSQYHVVQRIGFPSTVPR